MPQWIHSRAEHILAKNPSMSKSMAFAVATQQAHSLGKSPKGYGTAEGRSEAKAKFNTPKDDEKRSNPGGLKSEKLAGITPDARLIVEGTHEGVVSAARILSKIQALGSGGHSFSIVSPDDMKEPGGGNLGGWDGDGNTHLVSARVETLDGKTSKTIMEGGKSKIGSTVLAVVKCAGLLSTVRGLPSVAKGVALGTNELNMHRNEIAGLGVLAVPGLDTMQSRIRARLAGDKTEHGAEKRRLLGEGAHAALDVGGLGLLAAPAVAHLKHAFANSAYAGQPAQNGPGMKGQSQIPGFTAPPIEVKTSAPLHRLGELVTGSRASKLRDAALRHADSAAQGGSRGARQLKASRKLRSLAHQEEHNVGKMQGALAGAAGLGAVSDATGLAEKARNKEAGVGVGAGMTASQYSGPLSYGPFKMTSQIPAFTAPSMTKEESGTKAAASMATATDAMSPAGKLNVTQRVGSPKTTGFSGPSIADVAKPKGFGTPMPGAQKNQI